MSFDIRDARDRKLVEWWEIHQEADKEKEEVEDHDKGMQELELLRELYQATVRMHNTPIVDDDYPEMRFYFDSAMHAVKEFYKKEEG
jgi:hypothetical protein